jgi:hypothetical protein
MRFKMIHRGRVGFFVMAACVCAASFTAADADAQSERKHTPLCAIRCAAPPEGCRYVGMVTTGPCHAVRCGRLICEEMCSLPCAPPPEGCFYENAMPTGPCGSNLTCGHLDCDGGALGTP